MLLATRLGNNVNCKQQFCRLTGCELFDYVTQKDYLEEQEAANYVRNILQATKYLHENNICHLDIKVPSTSSIQGLHKESLHATKLSAIHDCNIYSLKILCWKIQLLARLS